MFGGSIRARSWIISRREYPIESFFTFTKGMRGGRDSSMHIGGTGRRRFKSKVNGSCTSWEAHSLPIIELALYEIQTCWSFTRFE